MQQATTVRAGLATTVAGSTRADQSPDQPLRLVRKVASEQPARPAPEVEPRRRRVYFVRRRDWALYSQAEAAVLIDSAIAHHHPAYETIEEVEAVDPPSGSLRAARLADPILIIDAREAVLYPRSRRLMIVKDSRTRTGLRF